MGTTLRSFGASAAPILSAPVPVADPCCRRQTEPQNQREKRGFVRFAPHSGISPAPHQNLPQPCLTAPFELAECDFTIRTCRSSGSLLQRNLIRRRAVPQHRHIPCRAKTLCTRPHAQTIRGLPPHPHRPRRCINTAGLCEMSDKFGLPKRRPTVPAGADGDGMKSRNARRWHSAEECRSEVGV